MNAVTNPIFSHSLALSLKKFTCCAVPKPTNFNSQNAPQQEQRLLPLWSAAEIAEAVNGRLLKWGPPGTISTDTRTLQPHQWFFAICGENFDAHDFITPELSNKGCVGVIGKRICENWDKGFVEINGDTAASLIRMASYARDSFSGDVIGVTGSVGKTTTRTMIALALGGGDANSVYQTTGNWNNRIGVALTLVGMLRTTAKISVLEAGMSRKGEMLELARMIRPNLRVVLRVGPAHLANFASLEEVAMAKGEMLMEARPGEDVCVLNADDPLVMSLPVPRGVKRVLYGRRMGYDVRLVAAESTDGGHAVRVVLMKEREM